LNGQRIVLMTLLAWIAKFWLAVENVLLMVF